MDRSWMTCMRTSDEYVKGVEEFIQFAMRNASRTSQLYLCPCVRCLNGYRRKVDEIRDHLVCNGIDLHYTTWKWHGEELPETAPSLEDTNEDEDDDDGMQRMIEDIGMWSNVRSDQYEKLRNDAEIPLYGGCKYTRLTATLQLVNLKATCGWTDKSFTLLLTLLCDMFPEDNVLPNRMYEAKKVLSTTGLKYKKIHACPNDCVLYRNEYKDLKTCPKCNTSRYKVKEGGLPDDVDVETTAHKAQQPLKVMWYLPIVPRFKRLFACESKAKHLVWHSEDRISDDMYLRHPADSPQWKKIDNMFPAFGNEPRNLRLGLCTDGINPYGTLSSIHSA